MSRAGYWKLLLPALGLSLAGLAALSLFLLAAGLAPGTVGLILAVWAAGFALYAEAGYRARKHTLDRLLQAARSLDERYLLAEVMGRPRRADDAVFYQLLKLAEKSMLEQVEAARRQQAAYREYIEQWVHEVKTPITAMKLLCENHPSAHSRELLAELEKTRRCTEQALYYARSEHPEADYAVHELPLAEIVHGAIADSKYLLRQSGVSLQLDGLDQTVCTDEKWVRFILGQLIANAVQYRTTQPSLRFAARRQGGQVQLLVQDNGLGIPAAELPRVFDKGFTGRNGRLRPGATGLGLYLCRQLCGKLGIGLALRSDGQGTEAVLTFCVDHFALPG